MYFKSYDNKRTHQRPRVRHDVRVCARQNLKLLKITFYTVLSANQVISSVSKISARARPRARRCSYSTYGTEKRRFFA